LVRLSGIVTEITTPVASEGPQFDAVSVYAMVPPGDTLDGSPVMDNRISALRASNVPVTVVVLFPRNGSTDVDDAVTVWVKVAPGDAAGLA